MADRFAALGFAVATDADLDRLVQVVLDEAEPVQRPDGGATHVCGTASRAALAVHTDPGGAVSCVTPFLSAQTRTTMRFGATVRNSECEHCSLLVADMWGPAGVLRVRFTTPHFQLWADSLPPGTAVEVGLAGIVESMGRVDAHATAGLWVEEESAGANAAVPMAQVAGVVQSHFLRHNDLGGGVFEWATIDVGGVALELAAAPGDLDVPFTSGAVVSGRVFLSGPIWEAVEG